MIGGDGTAYVGSADGSLYAVGANGRLRWRFRTGGVREAGPASEFAFALLARYRRDSLILSGPPATSHRSCSSTPPRASR